MLFYSCKIYQDINDMIINSHILYLLAGTLYRDRRLCDALSCRT